MKKFKVIVTETLKKEFEVCANSKQDAVEIMMKRYIACEDDDVILTLVDHSGTSFNAEEL